MKVGFSGVVLADSKESLAKVLIELAELVKQDRLGTGASGTYAGGGYDYDIEEVGDDTSLFDLYQVTVETVKGKVT